MEFKINKLCLSFGQVKLKALIFIGVLCVAVSILVGCDALVRKFTRKPKKEKLEKEEMVLAPEAYKGPDMTKEELYRQSFLFWKSWQDELINYLSPGANHKKQIDCAEQTIKNLVSLKTLLNESSQKKLDAYIGQLTELKDLITKDVHGNNIVNNRQKAERIKRNILRDFSYNKISKDITYGT
jgi:hypothetical protein